MRFKFLVLLAVVASTLAAPAVVSGQEIPGQDNETTTPERPTIDGTVGNGIRVVSADLEGDTWRIVLESDYPVTVRVVDVFAGMEGMEEGGSQNFNPNAGENTVNLVPGTRQEVTIPATEYDGAQGVMVISPNDGWARFTETAGNDPFKSFGGTTGLLSGMAISVMFSGAAALYVVYGNDPDVRRAE